MCRDGLLYKLKDKYAIAEDLPSMISVVHQRARLIKSRGRLSEEDDQNTTLLDHLREPVPKESYHGNQYQLDDVAKGSEIPAERLLESWNWLSEIRKTIERLLDDRPQNPLRLFLKVITIDELAGMVMESLKAGQNLVPIGVFEYDLVTPIVRAVQAKFVEKIGIDEAKMWSSVFDDYVTLFDDDEIARLHTHREWWIKCLPSEWCPSILSSKMLDAFSLRNVAIEEESRVFEQGRVTLSKMLAINSKLLALLDEHPFDYIVFPTHQLPMTVPPRPWCDGGQGGPEYTRRTLILRNLPGYKQN
ncbi:hypothetical protein OSTOST_11561 [Ostertagia ostertagi]